MAGETRLSLTQRRLMEELAYLGAVREALHDQERALANFVDSWSAQCGSAETETRQHATKAMAAVQAAQNRIGKAVESMADVVPEEPTLPGMGGEGEVTVEMARTEQG